MNAARVAHQGTEDEPDIDTNITPSADDYEDDDNNNNSLAINIPDSSNKYEEAATTTTAGGGGDTNRSRATPKDIHSPNLNVPDNNNTPKGEKTVNSPKEAGTQGGAEEKMS